MARLRIRIVTGPAGGFTPLQKFLLASFLVHLGMTVVLVLIPELRRGPRIPHDATVVELVGALPGARPEPAVSAPAPRPQPPAPKPPKKEEVTVQSQEPEPAQEKKPTDKPPEPVEDENPPQPSPGPARPPLETDEQQTPSSDAGSAATGASVSALEIGGAAFAWYRSSVANALYGHWRRPVIGGLVEPIEVRVAFEIMRDGNVRGLRIDESSGVPSLDRSALRAVSDATPLPALPSALSEPYLPASIVFRLYPEGY